MPFTNTLTTFFRTPIHLDTPDHVAFNDNLTAETARLESSIRNALAESNHDKIAKIVHQLCHDYAYAVHQPHARNGGLIGLAAAAIALGSVRSNHTPTTLSSYSNIEADVPRR